jgi:RecA-family ATPase
LLAGAVTLGYAAPGLGKTLIGGLTAIAVITGRCDLTGETTHLKGPVLIINNEEPIEELQKRIGAACQEYRIDKAEVDGKLFLLSGLGARILVAIKDKDKVGVTAVVAELKRYLKQHSIVHVSFDPLVSLHSGTSEMDNDDMEKVFSILADIANDCGVSVEAIHHTRKGQGRVSSDKGAGREDFRGAQSQGGSARVTYKIVRVHPKHQAWPRIPPELRTGSHRLVALHAQKANYSADTTEVVAVFAIKSVTIANGDDVGVPIIVKLSSPTEALLSQDAKILRVIAETMENMTYGATAKASEFYPAIMAAFDVKRRTAMDYLGEAFAAQNPAITITTAGKHYKLRMTEGGNGSSRKITMDPAEDEDEEI